MATKGQFSSKNPTIKRILKEASELASQPSPDYHAAPLETDIFEWHFTIRGPPAPSPYATGIYHGRIILPPAYPLKPPSFRFLTPTGRFEVNREICLSISGHHEETWQPAWGIRTALVAIRSFMDTGAGGQVGGMECGEAVRRRLAGQSAAWKCGACGKTNEEVMREVEAVVGEAEGEGRKKEVPEELRLAYREDLGKGGGGGEKKVEAKGKKVVPSVEAQGQPAQSSVAAAAVATQAAPTAAPTQQQVQRPRHEDDVPAWIDKAIYGVLAMLLFLIWRRYG
ncbi:UBC-like protein [Teratosphaeria nubilosa]|uniref:UBC-like protein n=1 Tax=Teratosphaeria nubilosa TaxID=161662 RepID=A0A6G1LK11_9PEZI|nr:UBC-like protein [Teratosphaeria nubilosa]